jgi:hypothetical protein
MGSGGEQFSRFSASSSSREKWVFAAASLTKVTDE